MVVQFQNQGGLPAQDILEIPHHKRIGAAGEICNECPEQLGVAFDEFSTFQIDLPRRPIHVLLDGHLLQVQEIDRDHRYTARCEFVGNPLVRFGDEGVIRSAEQDYPDPVGVLFEHPERLPAHFQHTQVQLVLYATSLGEGLHHFGFPYADSTCQCYECLHLRFRIGGQINNRGDDLRAILQVGFECPSQIVWFALEQRARAGDGITVFHLRPFDMRQKDVIGIPVQQVMEETVSNLTRIAERCHTSVQTLIIHRIGRNRSETELLEEMGEQGVIGAHEKRARKTDHRRIGRQVVEVGGKLVIHQFLSLYHQIMLVSINPQLLANVVVLVAGAAKWICLVFDPDATDGAGQIALFATAGAGKRISILHRSVGQGFQIEGFLCQQTLVQTAFDFQGNPVSPHQPRLGRYDDMFA